MPYSFTKIEEDKTKTISFVFFFLIFIYFAIILLISILARNLLNYQASPRYFSFQFFIIEFPNVLLILGIALITGYMHWSFTTQNLITKILGILKAEKLNPKDRYHQMFANIVDEVSVATGGRKMEPVILPTIAMNAFALCDFSGRAVIGLTEGMLARLTRAQIEAVVGHEAAHIVAGDCLATTVTTSLFELFSGMLRGFEVIFRGGGKRGGSIRLGRGGGAVIVFLLLTYILLALTKFLSQLVRLFLSREREYRADAIAVRLTRDPLSLAEALYAIGYRWRGGGLPAAELESIFIVNPSFSAIDEREGAWSEMFSTHPPINARLNILLDMAHSDIELVIKDVDRQARRPRTDVPEVSGNVSSQWMAHKDGVWEGPFSLAQMAGLGWLAPETWIKPLGQGKVHMVYEDQDVNRVITKSDEAIKSSAFHCPKCDLPLNIVAYEGTEVHKCSSCRGTLVEENDIKRIIIRADVGFSDKIKKIAEGIQQSTENRGVEWQRISRDPKTLVKCPKCQYAKTRMMRMFYTDVYRVEVDRCFNCGLIWFDGDELEVLQYLIECSVSKSSS